VRLYVRTSAQERVWSGCGGLGGLRHIGFGRLSVRDLNTKHRERGSAGPALDLHALGLGLLDKELLGGLSRWVFLLFKGADPAHSGSRVFCTSLQGQALVGPGTNVVHLIC